MDSKNVAKRANRCNVRQRQTLTVINKRPPLVMRRTTFDRRRWPVYHNRFDKLVVEPVVLCRHGVNSASHGPPATVDTCLTTPRKTNATTINTSNRLVDKQPTEVYRLIKIKSLLLNFVVRSTDISFSNKWKF